MRTCRTPKTVLIRLLCVLAVLLMLTGCSSSEEELINSVSETETISAETSPDMLPTEATVSDSAPLTDFTEGAAGTNLNTSDELLPLQPEDADAITDSADTMSDGPVEETVSIEAKLSADLATAQEENQLLQTKLEELSNQQKKQHQALIIIAAASMVVSVIALLFLYFWRKAVAALKRARKKNARKDPDVPITQIAVGKTHGIGGRSTQQDSFSVSPAELYTQNGVLAVVADGMGGLENGDLASQTAVISAMESFYQITGTGSERLLQMLALTKNAVNTAKAELGTNECGTTLLMGLIQNGEFHYVSVGDSRIYLYRAGRLIQLNREHAYLYDQLHQAINGKIGMKEAFADEKNSCITSFLGMQDIAHIDIPATPISVLPKDKFLLMSDGVYNARSQEEICLAMRHPAQDAAEAIKSFISTKNFQDQDNYTLVVLECR